MSPQAAFVAAPPPPMTYPQAMGSMDQDLSPPMQCRSINMSMPAASSPFVDQLNPMQSSPAPTAPAGTPTDRLTALTNDQTAAGNWTLGPVVVQTLGKSVDYLDGGNSLGVSKEVWATALVLAYFKLSLSDIGNIWQLSANKATKWLRRMIGKDNVAAVIGLAESFLGN
mmetsp:Transcript_11585/g.15124  ORF Transcript_11585/g.15124 Transcript_11585/m.15124 type:complete len:169 (-) Transcript_11585:88-594(-)